ncbi:MAG: class I SAM-dependent methyltransferase [Nanoarchaeota archaeon]
MVNEFTGARSSLYKQALKEYPEARLDDIKIMKEYLDPKKGEKILEVGAGSGFFSSFIADFIGKEGKLIVSDPSKEQLDEVNELNKENIKVVQQGADSLNLSENSIDSIWSFGAMHHVFEKEKSFKNFHKVLKRGGKLIIGDVFSGSKLAQHFDTQVAKYCITGHEVAFWTHEYAESLCYLTGFEKPKFFIINQKWKFKTKKDIGIFLYKIHAMTKTNPEECLRGAEKILGVKKKGNLFELNWPMQIISTRKI